MNHIAGVLGISEDMGDQPVEHLLTDSRKLYEPHRSLFFALQGPRRDGHQFIGELYKKGLRAFVVSHVPGQSLYHGARFLQVNDPLQALQQLAAYHRSRFSLPVIGITGSNGKTIVKEWLYQLLHYDHQVVRSPKSYNSQTGVALSVWQLNEQASLGIFEAGISLPGEMEKLEPMILPSIGILTNIGAAHNEGFASLQQKTEEKLRLFARCRQIIFCRDYAGTDILPLWYKDRELYDWSRETKAWLQVTAVEKKGDCSLLQARRGKEQISITIPFTDDAAVENAITCWCLLLVMGCPQDVIRSRMLQLQPVNMRLELKKGINQCTVINDSYSADINSLQIALNFLDQQGGDQPKTVILSDFLQSAEKDEDLYRFIVAELVRHRVTRLIGIGERISQALAQLAVGSAHPLRVELYPSTGIFLQQFLSSRFHEEVVLVKGARVFEFEKIVQLLEQKVHQTVLEINLNALVHNVNVYRHRLKPSVKIMAMVKAFAYGSGGAEIAGILQYHKVDYLGVAYADEGVELRKAGISLPIMVMNPEEAAFDAIVEHNLEPDLYSFKLLHGFETFLQAEAVQGYPVHIEIETGMNRLGFAGDDIPLLARHLAGSSLLRVRSVFSHLAASEDPAEDAYTFAQYNRYKEAAGLLQQELPYAFIRHIANTGAIFRLPELQLDMVRLGIGMYGIDSAVEHQSLLQPVASLKTTIAQLRDLEPGESVSYNRRGMVDRPSRIATVRIGYADGFSRRLGYGVGKIWVGGRLAPVIGTVCMDMTMIDVTDIPGVHEGDEVIIFGPELPVQQVAAWAGTIPYEIMTGISQRVKRVYFEE